LRDKEWLVGQITVFPGLERRRRWSEEERVEILAEAFSPRACVAEVARRGNVSTALIYTWRASWADIAYRIQANEKWLRAQGRVSRVHRRKPRGKAMSDHVRRRNATKSKIRARVEHVFAQQKAKMRLFTRTTGIKRRRGEDHAGQSGLQHEPTDLP
jgi:transposase-like protein